jgi:hypothetical protein
MAIKEMSVGKWVLLFMAALFLSVLLYAFSSLTTLISIGWVRWVCTLVVAAAMLGLYSLFVHWFEGHWAQDLPMRKCLPHTVAGLGVGLGYFVVVVAIMMAFGVYKIIGIGNEWTDIVSSFFVFLLVAIGEEVIFRGVFFRWIDEKWGFMVALVLSALIFGLVHITNDNASLWSSLAIAIEAGLLLGAIYKYSGTLWAPIGVHWAWNFSQGNIFGFEVSGTDAGASLLQSSVSGSEWLTGGAFGAEASVISVVVGAAVSAWLVWKIYKRA